MGHSVTLACYNYLVVGVDVVDQIVAGDALDVLGGSEDGSAQGRALVSHRVQVIEHHLLQVHVHLLHLPAQKQHININTELTRDPILPENDSSFPFNLLLAEGAVGEDV